MRGGGSRAAGAHDHQWSFDGVGRGLGPVVRIPILDAEAVHEATDDDRLDASGGVGIIADVGSHRGDEALEAVLPAVGSEVGATGLDLRALEQHVRGHAHGATTNRLLAPHMQRRLPRRHA